MVVCERTEKNIGYQGALLAKEGLGGIPWVSHLVNQMFGIALSF